MKIKNILLISFALLILLSAANADFISALNSKPIFSSILKPEKIANCTSSIETLGAQRLGVGYQFYLFSGLSLNNVGGISYTSYNTIGIPITETYSEYTSESKPFKIKMSALRPLDNLVGIRLFKDTYIVIEASGPLDKAKLKLVSGNPSGKNTKGYEKGDKITNLISKTGKEKLTIVISDIKYDSNSNETTFLLQNSKGKTLATQKVKNVDYYEFKIEALFREQLESFVVLLEVSPDDGEIKAAIWVENPITLQNNSTFKIPNDITGKKWNVYFGKLTNKYEIGDLPLAVDIPMLDIKTTNDQLEQTGIYTIKKITLTR